MIAYCYSRALEEFSNRLPSNLGRSTLIHRLIEAYGILESPHTTIVEVFPATYQELTRYHSQGYIDAINGSEMVQLISDDDRARFGLDYDCPVFDGLAQYVAHVAGASLCAASTLIHDPSISVAINWDGGRHHAKKGAASGFCYVADAVLAIQRLRDRFEGVIYIDLDVHHGDGVEAAFLYSDKVLTISLHRFEHGFFPNSGRFEDHGKGKGKGYALNIPLLSGLCDDSLLTLVQDVVNVAIVAYARNRQEIAIVMQCGLDGLAQDPLQQWNLSIKGFTTAVLAIQKQAELIGCPVLYLGGGGYKRDLASRCYAFLTAQLVGKSLQSQIPEHLFWSEYASTSHDLAVSLTNLAMRDRNVPLMNNLILNSVRQISKYIH